MRFRSQPAGGYVIHAVSGVNTISFAIDAAGADTAGLLGFAVERLDPQADEQYFMYGFKVFQSVIPAADQGPGREHLGPPGAELRLGRLHRQARPRVRYRFHPLKGNAEEPRPQRGADPIEVQHRAALQPGAHDVFFNRGVASSQAYERQFGNKRPDDPQPATKRREALDWLSRDLDDAILKFIDYAKAGDTLLCCFYEFRYEPVVEALKAAIDRGVDVQVIIDAKENGRTDKRASSTRASRGRRTCKASRRRASRRPASSCARRSATTSSTTSSWCCSRARRETPAEVWTGSTNISVGGIHGQTNVGHWVRDRRRSRSGSRPTGSCSSDDPGGKAGDDRATVAQEEQDFKQGGRGDPRRAGEPGTRSRRASRRSSARARGARCCTVLRADRRGRVARVHHARVRHQQGLQGRCSRTTPPENQIVFLLLEKKDKPNPKANANTFVFVKRDATTSTRHGARSCATRSTSGREETNAQGLELNQHVSYIHSKFLLMDPLGDDPIVVTGSANFSDASTNDNDENMLIIRGDRRVADIYFTEFNRLFNHYYFRSVVQSLKDRDASVNMDAACSWPRTEQWLEKYKPGSLRAKRVEMFKEMAVG